MCVCVCVCVYVCVCERIIDPSAHRGQGTVLIIITALKAVGIDVYYNIIHVYYNVIYYCW